MLHFSILLMYELMYECYEYRCNNAQPVEIFVQSSGTYFVDAVCIAIN